MMAMSKLQSNSVLCIQTYQGIITHFSIKSVPEENVSTATSWLKAVVKALKLTNSIPNTALQSILRGMQHSKHRGFNMLGAILGSSARKFVMGFGKDVSEEQAAEIFAALDRLNEEYRMFKEAGQWPMARATSSALVSAPSPAPSSGGTSRDLVLQALSQMPQSDLLALLSRSSSSTLPSTANANPRANGLCFNPNCLSPDHVIKDCPVPLPPTYQDRSLRRGRSQSCGRDDRGRSQSRGRDDHGRSQSRGRDNSQSRDRGRSNSQGRSSTRTRAPTPGRLPSTDRSSQGVSFANVAALAALTADVDSDGSTYNDAAYDAFTLRGLSKE
jgi:hypothetical protein